MNKRSFLKNASMLGLSPPAFTQLSQWIGQFAHLSPVEVAKDEDLWSEIRKGYRIKEDYINLENGYYCFLPQQTLDRFIEHVKEVNYHGSWYMRTRQMDDKQEAATKLAKMAGCDQEELIITRNTTESLDLVIAGQDWKRGDEAVMAYQDYGAMLNQFKLMARRYGVVNKIVSLPNHPKNDDEIVELYSSAITEKTKLLMVCHIVNITGQILPVKKICDMAHERGVDVMVDGAHAFGHIDFSIDELNCDYYGTSLHKWLSVPLGAGFLYIRKGNAHKLWPLLAEDEREPDDISRLNHTGTHPVHTDLAITEAIDYHNMIGIERKEARLRYLQHYWTSKVRGLEKVIVNTPAEQHRHAAIGNVGIEGIEPSQLSKMLLEDYKIWTVAINRLGVKGLRITPGVYTSTDELDVLVKAIQEISDKA